MDNLQTVSTSPSITFDRPLAFAQRLEEKLNKVIASNLLTATNFSKAIAIVGGGCSGPLVAAQLRQAKTPLNIYLIERSPQLCRGVAYNTEADCHLLNVPAGKMSAFPDDPHHFLNWVQCQEHSFAGILLDEVQADTFVPRKLYGQWH